MPDRPPANKRTGLRAVLLVGGIVFVFFGLAAFLPTRTFSSLYNIYGNLVGEEYPISGSPLAIYILRLTLVAVLAIGILLLAAYRNPAACRPVVSFAVFLAAAYVIVAPIAGVMAGVSWRWFGLDAASALIFLVLLLVFRKQAG